MYDTETEKAQKNVEESRERAAYDEEISHELAEVRAAGQEPERDGVIANTNRNVWFGFASIVLSIVAFFTMPVIFGITAIVLGVLAKRSGSSGFATWGIVLGVISVIAGLVIYPFF